MAFQRHRGQQAARLALEATRVRGRRQVEMGQSGGGSDGGGWQLLPRALFRALSRAVARALMRE